MPLPERDEPQQATGVTDGAGRAHWMRRVLERAFARMLPATLDPAREDLVQTAVVRVLERGEREKDPVRTAYLWKVAFTVIADELRAGHPPGEALTRAKRTRMLAGASTLAWAGLQLHGDANFRPVLHPLPSSRRWIWMAVTVGALVLASLALLRRRRATASSRPGP